MTFYSFDQDLPTKSLVDKIVINMTIHSCGVFLYTFCVLYMYLFMYIYKISFNLCHDLMRRILL